MTEGYTLIAKWRPWVYYRIITFRVDGSSRMQRMISSLETALPLDQGPTRPDYFATVAMRCNRYGTTPPNTQPLLEREYETFEQAVQGHEMAVMVFGGRPTRHRGS